MWYTILVTIPRVSPWAERFPYSGKYGAKRGALRIFLAAAAASAGKNLRNQRKEAPTMIMNPTAIKHVVVDGHSLTLESFVAIARYNATVELAPSALEAMKKSRALAEKIAAEGRVAYGITTGFGEFQKVAVPKEMSNQLSTNLILSHCTGAGEPYADEIVRGMMLLRANALCGGVSGVRPLLVEMLLEMLNKGVTPIVPQKGSLGSSGDLAPLAHMTLPMLGKGEAMYQGKMMTGAEGMA